MILYVVEVVALPTTFFNFDFVVQYNMKAIHICELEFVLAKMVTLEMISYER